MMTESNAQKVMKGISSQTIVTIVLGIVEIVSFSIMSRLLTQDDFGYYAAITAITSVFASFSETGIGAALIQRKDINKKYIDNAFTLSLVFGLFISLLMFLSAGPISEAVIDKTLKVPLMLMSVTLLFNCLASVNFSLMQRELQFLKVGVINLLSLVVTTIVAIILALKGFGYYAILAKAILTSFLTLVISRIAIRVHFNLNIDKHTFKEIFGFSGWLMASVFFRNFAQQADKLLMGRLLSVSALGAYNRPKEFITQINTKFNGIFDTALFPVLSGIQDKKDILGNAYKKSLYYMNLFSMAMSLGFIFCSGLIIRIFLGEQWLDIQPVFMILSCAMIFNIDGRLVDCFMRSLALTRSQFFFRILELFINVVALLIGAHWNITGVAMAVVLTNFVMVIIKVIYISAKIELSVKSVLLTIFSSWQFSLVVLLILIPSFIILPSTAIGDILITFEYCLLLLLCFVIFPSIVGDEYKAEAYCKIKGFLYNKVLVKLKKIGVTIN